MTPISRNEIPLTRQLYRSLGFNPKSGRPSKDFADATYAWRRQYLERFGLALKDLLDWDKNRNQFRSIAATFLMNHRNGETYWPSDDRSESDVPKCPRDQALLVDLLSQLFWRQIANEHQNRDRHSQSMEESEVDEVEPKTLPNPQDDLEQADLVRARGSLLQSESSIMRSVPKVPHFHENWNWPHSQLGRTRGVTLLAANAVRPTEGLRKNQRDVKLLKVPTKGSAGFSITNARHIVNLFIDGVGHASSDGISQNSWVSLDRNVSNTPAELNTGIGPQGEDNRKKAGNVIDFDRYAGRLKFWKRQRDIDGEGQLRSSLEVTNAKHSRPWPGSLRPVATGPLLHGLADGLAGAGQVAAFDSNCGQTATVPLRGLGNAIQATTFSKSTEIHYNIITARKPRLCNVTWTGGELSNGTWAGLLEEVSQYIEGAYVESITFTLQMRAATYITSVDRQDENTFNNMRNRWEKIIKQEMAEGINSVFNVDLEPKYRAPSEKVRHAADEEFDITL